MQRKSKREQATNRKCFYDKYKKKEKKKTK